MKGYEKEFKEAIDKLSSKGIVVSYNALNQRQSVIYQYDFDTGRFNVRPQNELMDLFSRFYINSYGKQYNFIQVSKALKRVTNSQLRHYHQHLELKNQSHINIRNLCKLTEDILKRNESRKKPVQKRLSQLALQIQFLINNDVFIDTGNFYRYNGRKFIQIESLMRVFSKVSEDNPHISASTVNMNRGVYAKYLTNGNGVISQWFDYELRQKKLSDSKSDYDRISNIIKTFE